IGIIHSDQGNYAQALEYYQKSLTLSEALDDKVGVARALNNIGRDHKNQGAYAQALEYYQKSLALSEALDDKDRIARALNNIGVVHRSQGAYAQALECFQKSLAMRESLGDKAGIADALNDIAEVHKDQGHHSQSLDFAERATALTRQIGYIEELWQARLTAGTAYRALNQPAQARRALEEAISAIETLRAQIAGGEQDQQRFLENNLSPYYAMAELLVAQNQASEALIFAERAKARVLLDVLQSGRVNIAKAMTAQEQEQEQRWHNQLVSLNSQISRENLRQQPDSARLDDLKAQLQKARLEYKAFQTTLYAAHPELKSQRGESAPLTLEQTRDLLPDTQSALLEYVVSDEKTYLFAMTSNAAGTALDLKVYPLEIKGKELGERAAKFRETLAKGSP